MLVQAKGPRGKRTCFSLSHLLEFQPARGTWQIICASEVDEYKHLVPGLQCEFQEQEAELYESRSEVASAFSEVHEQAIPPSCSHHAEARWASGSCDWQYETSGQ